MGTIIYSDGQRVALRKGDGTLYFLLTDHLGSTAITATSGGIFSAEMRYYPWGGTRYTSGTTPTSYRYTGQREAEVGLYYYGARFYDPTLGRFISADPLIAYPVIPISFDRYCYVLNSPLRYVDPSGYFADDKELARYLGYNSLEELYNSRYWQIWTELGILDLIRRAEFTFGNILVLEYEDGTSRQFMIVRWDLDRGRDQRVGLYALDTGQLYGVNMYEAFLQSKSGALFKNNSGDDFDQFSFVAGNHTLPNPTLAEGWRHGQGFDINLHRMLTNELIPKLIVGGLGVLAGAGLIATFILNPPVGTIATYTFGVQCLTAITSAGIGIYSYFNSPVIIVVEYWR